ncbi:MAG: 4'-phosphopantetheinyl transferase superfamily protein [Hydrogenophaga sp.]|uniref:4'-phosphopantetheinyl transferase family protein n=1 Tax=Hydrogenophaga sp. TaxID=1904254 RepID=UPI002717017A|nr:4'-phosphopantetheinyl transferase superfamily protein [Hydrogenophaga sp.]MDO9031041.1 4'-phosphopantetheinyl transferase superfamily protein [Hydrogenophaga sp.]
MRLPARGLPGRVDLHAFACVPHAAQAVLRLHAPLLEAWKSLGVCGAPQLPASASAARQLEHFASRAAAAALLRSQGAADTTVMTGDDRAPVWPDSFVGSISHSAQLACVAVQPASACHGLGIDAQPWLTPQAAADVRMRCVDEAQWHALAEFGMEKAAGWSDSALLTLAFSAKEAFFKCVYPRVGRYFEYTDARLDPAELAQGRIRMRMVVAAGPQLPAGFTLNGTASFALGHVFTAFVWPAD